MPDNIISSTFLFGPGREHKLEPAYPGGDGSGDPR